MKNLVLLSLLVLSLAVVCNGWWSDQETEQQSSSTKPVVEELHSKHIVDKKVEESTPEIVKEDLETITIATVVTTTTKEEDLVFTTINKEALHEAISGEHVDNVGVGGAAPLPAPATVVSAPIPDAPAPSSPSPPSPATTAGAPTPTTNPPPPVSASSLTAKEVMAMILERFNEHYKVAQGYYHVASDKFFEIATPFYDQQVKPLLAEAKPHWNAFLDSEVGKYLVSAVDTTYWSLDHAYQIAKENVILGWGKVQAQFKTWCEEESFRSTCVAVKAVVNPWFEDEYIVSTYCLLSVVVVAILLKVIPRGHDGREESPPDGEQPGKTVVIANGGSGAAANPGSGKKNKNRN
jgi:hypothetical protein